MIEIQVSRESARALEQQLQALGGEKAHAAISRAAKRAATHAKKIGTKLVRQEYTVDSSSIKSTTSVHGSQGGAVFRIVGRRLGADHYKAKKRRQGIFVSVRKGSGDIVPRSFDYSNTYFHREGRPRLPIARIFGPAVPQLFGNEAIKEEIAEAAMQKYEERVRHEVGRLMG